MNRDRRLIVRGRGKGLALFGRDGRVLLDQLGHHAAQGLDAQRQRRHVQQQNVFHIAFEHPALDGGTDSHDLVGVHALVGVFPEDLLDPLLNRGHTGHAADQNYLVDVRIAQARVFHGDFAGHLEIVEKIGHQPFQLGPRNPDIEMFRPARVSGDEGQVDVGFHGARQLHLGFFRRLFQALQSHLVVSQIDPLVPLEFIGQVVDQPEVEILAAQMGVAVRGLHLEDAVADFKHRNVEGSAAQVEHHDLFLGLFIETVGQRGRGRLVDDPEHVETCDLAGVLGCLALAVVEVCRHGDHRVGHRFPQVFLGGFFDVAQDKRRYLGRAVVFVADVDPDVAVRCLLNGKRQNLDVVLDLAGIELPSDEPFDAKDRILGIGDGLSLGDLPDETLARFRNRHHRRGGPSAFGIGDDLRLSSFHDRHTRVCRTEVNAYYFTHFISSLGCIFECISCMYLFRVTRIAVFSCTIVQVVSALSGLVSGWRGCFRFGNHDHGWTQEPIIEQITLLIFPNDRPVRERVALFLPHRLMEIGIERRFEGRDGLDVKPVEHLQDLIEGHGHPLDDALFESFLFIFMG